MTISQLLKRTAEFDRRWIYLLVGLGTLIPIIYPLGLPVTTSEPVRKVFNYIEGLQAGDKIMVSFDYGPSTSPENDPMALAIMRHCALKRVKMVILALYPLGGLTMAVNMVEQLQRDFPQLQYGIDYINLGYKDGGQAPMKKMGQNLHEVFPIDFTKRPIAEFEIMQNVKTYHNIKLVVSLATGIIGEWWANLVNAQYGVPVAVGPTAVSAPKYYAYLRAGQMMGIIGGLKGASEYEKLLTDNYPELNALYGAVGVYTASKGMDAQSIVHSIIILFIILGNLAFILKRARA